MKRWEEHVGGYTHAEIQTYVAQNLEWQKFRESLKGIATEVKLDKLKQWYDTRIDRYTRPTRVQVDFYIYTLKNCGFLNDRLEVIR